MSGHTQHTLVAEAREIVGGDRREAPTKMHLAAILRELDGNAPAHHGGRLRLFNRVEITASGRRMAALLADEDTGPSLSVERAFRALNEGRQIVRSTVNLAGLEETTTVTVADLARADELLTEANDYVDKMRELLERTERQMAETYEKYVREKFYATRVEEKNSELCQTIVRMAAQIDELDAQAAAHDAQAAAQRSALPSTAHDAAETGSC